MNSAYLTGIQMGLVLLAAAIGMLCFIASVYFLAKLNIFFTLVKEGTAKAVLRFGKFRKIVMSYKSHDINENWEVVEREQFSWFKLFSGLRWIGFPIINTVHKYRFSWSSYEQIDESGKIMTKPKTTEKEIDFILVQDDVYFTVIEAAETKGMVPVDVSLLLTLRVKNPYKALFRIQHWLEASLNRVKPAFRSFIAQKEFKDLIAQKEAIEEQVGSFIAESKIDEFILNNYGVELVAVEMVKIDPSGKRGEAYAEAASKLWEAERELERIKTIADAETQRIDRIYTKIKSFGEEGMFLRTLEAVEQAGKEPGKFVIFPLGGIKDLIKNWTGKKGE